MRARDSLRAYYAAARFGNLLDVMKKWGADKFSTTFTATMRKSATTSYGMPELDEAMKKAGPAIQRQVKAWVNAQMKNYHSPEHQQNIKELGDHILMRDYDALKVKVARLIRAKLPEGTSISDKKLQYVVNTIVDDAQTKVISQWLKLVDEKQAKEPPT